jgi:hypothetical protein
MSRLRVLSTALASSLLATVITLPAPAAAATTTAAPTMTSRMTAVLAAKSINYYPSDAAWSAMWSGFDAAKIDADLAKAAALGADNVRVIVFPQTFGYPTPTAVYADRLKRFVNLADAHRMTVKLTLFDWWDGYTDVADSIAWARTVLAPYAGDRRVIAVEL